MSLVGNLEDLGLGEILQIVSLSRKSGLLSLQGKGREARIIFQNGQVIRASSSTFHQNLGEVLVQKGVIDLTTLKRALSIQADEGFSQLLGGIMVERFGVSADDIERVVREQTENVVYSLFAWAEGTFEFELQESPEGEATRQEPALFTLKQGLNPQYLAMEGSRIIDEQRHRGETGEGEEPPGTHEDNIDFAFDLLQEPSDPAAAKDAGTDLTPPPARGDRGVGEAGSSGAGLYSDPFATLSEADPFAAASAQGDPFASGGTGEGDFPHPLCEGRGDLFDEFPGDGNGTRLVLVDDDPQLLEVLAPRLERRGYRVDAITGSEEALIRIDTLFREGERPTVVVDLVMPKMDGTGIVGGLELMELVRNNFVELPVLALSDFANEEGQRKVRGMGIPLLMKPQKSELDESFADFYEMLVSALSGLEPAGAMSVQGVNIGEELRLEMGEEPAVAVPHAPQSTGISHLRGMLEELNNPHLGGGIILLVLRFAAEFMNRAVVMLVKKESIEGLGQFGLEDGDGSADSRVRNLRIPRAEESLFTGVLETRFPLRGEVEDTPWNRFFLDQLGDQRPMEVFVGPIISEGKVVALLYGDNIPEQRPVGDTDSLEIFLGQAGIAMEKALLQRRLQDQGRGGN